MESPVKITFNTNESFAQVHDLGLTKTMLLVLSLYGGIAFWVIAGVMLFDSSYR